MDILDYVARRSELVNRALDVMLPGEDNAPQVLHEAMRYSVLPGGKRIRPVLAMAAAEAVGKTPDSVLPLAAALECVHAYSLIHDDLPAMDNDDLRRGKPTVHKVFGEAIAILAGDALLTLAFELLSSPETVRVYRPERVLVVIGELARAAGSHALVGGQAVDILSEGKQVDLKTVDYIVRAKTGALIRAALVCGAVLAGGNHEQVELLGRYGTDLGIMFQIKDDILDIEGDPAKMGKAACKDESRGKATYPGLLGPERAKEMIRGLVASSLEALRPFGDAARPLALLSRFVAERVH
ncbi:MAG: polyprenyl synthetase family protein [Thermodesulfobacteriota bacterium]